jgi:hypothetical protein
MITFSEFFRESIDWRILNEAGLSRIVKHLANRNVGIVSAFRDASPETLAANRARNRELQTLIRQAGFGYLRLVGSWIENEGTPEERRVIEESFFVIGSEDDDNGNLKGFLKKMMNKYSQDAVIFKPWNSSVANLIFRDNPATLTPIGAFSVNPQNIGTMYSKFKGHPFVFHSLSEQRSFMSRLAYQKGYRATS